MSNQITIYMGGGKGPIAATIPASALGGVVQTANGFASSVGIAGTPTNVVSVSVTLPTGIASKMILMASATYQGNPGAQEDVTQQILVDGANAYQSVGSLPTQGYAINIAGVREVGAAQGAHTVALSASVSGGGTATALNASLVVMVVTV